MLIIQALYKNYICTKKYHFSNWETREDFFCESKRILKLFSIINYGK